MSGTPQEEALAARRFMVLGVVRIAAILTLILGLAMARNVIDAPYWLGVGLAVAGMLAFFFAPWMLAKRWKGGDRAAEDGARGE